MSARQVPTDVDPRKVKIALVAAGLKMQSFAG
jgi:hypothetical protein